MRLQILSSFSIEVQLIYSIVLVSGVQQSDSVCVYIHIHILFSVLSHYSLLQNIAYSSCAIQLILLVYVFYIDKRTSVNPILPVYPSSFPPCSLLTINFYFYASASVL